MEGVSSMNNKKINISKNLIFLRKMKKFSIEEVADKINVSRQAVAKWENNVTIPDLINCTALADLYDVSVDDLIFFDDEENEFGITPKGKYIFGTATLGKRGQVVIPKKARDIMELKVGDTLIVLGEKTLDSRGIALVPHDWFIQQSKEIMDHLSSKDN